METNNAFLIIDTAKIYKISTVENDLGKEENSYLQFTKNGKIIYFAKTNYNDSILQVPSKYRKGEYYINKNKNFIIREYFKHPQGGGWIKQILVEKDNDTLYFRFENYSCNKRIKLSPL